MLGAQGSLTTKKDAALGRNQNRVREAGEEKMNTSGLQECPGSALSLGDPGARMVSQDLSHLKSKEWAFVPRSPLPLVSGMGLGECGERAQASGHGSPLWLSAVMPLSS